MKSVTGLLGLTPRVGVIGWIVFVVTTAALLLLTPDAGGRWQDWLAFAAISTAGAVAVTGLPGTLPASRGWIAAGLCLAASTLPLWVPTQEYAAFAPWYLRAITEVSAWLVLRALPVQGWVVAVPASALVAVLGEPIAIVRQLATLLAVQVLVFALTRAIATIAGLRAEERQRVETDSARSVAVETRRRELAVLSSRASPLLNRLESGEDSPTIRREASALESELRDLLRGRRLAEEPLATAVRNARDRGLDVLLLDDLDGPWDGGERTRSAAAILLDSASDDVTIRLSREGVTFTSGAEIVQV